MIASFKAELLKLRKRPATWILLGVVLGLTQLFGYVLPYSSWLTSDQNFQTQGLEEVFLEMTGTERTGR